MRPVNFQESMFFDEEDVLQAIAGESANNPFFSSQQALNKVAPPQHNPYAIYPTPHEIPGMQPQQPAPQQPMPQQPPPQPMPQGDGGWSAFGASPGMAMADQAMMNIDAMRRGRTPTRSPADAYQQSVQRNALLKLREKESDALQQYREDSLAVQALKAALPSAQMEKANLFAKSQGFANLNEALDDPEFLPLLGEFLKPASLVNIQQGEGTTWDQAIIDRSVADYSALMDAGAQAGNRTNRLQMMLALNENIEVGGSLGQSWTSIKTALDGMGIDLPGINEDTSYEQVFSALATQNQFERTAMLKGAISEKELDLAGRMDGSLANTQSGRRVILNYRLLEQARISELAEAAEAYRVRVEGEGKNYRESDFRQSPEYQALKEKPFMTRQLFEALRDVNEPGASRFKVGEEMYVLKDGIWYTGDKDGKAVPVRFYGE